MSAFPASIVCDRVRAQVSLELDGELSQLEIRMLDAHLARCAHCAEYAAEVRDVTARIRREPLEAIRRPVVVHLRRRTLATARVQVGVAAAFALAALGLGTQLATLPESASEAESLARFEGRPNLSPPRSVFEQEQAILRVVRAGHPLPPQGSVL